MTDDGDHIDQLLHRLDLVARRAGALAAGRRSTDPEPDDPFRGLHISPEQFAAIMARGPARVGAPIEPPAGRLAVLADRCGLTDLDVELLLIALAPDVDRRFEQLYGYLNDDVTRRRASIALALELSGADPADPSARARLAAGGPLLDTGLIEVEDLDRPILSRAVRVPDRVVAHLLGDERIDPALRGVLRTVPGVGAEWPGLGAALDRGVRLCYVRDPGTASAAAAVQAAGRAVLDLDLRRIDLDADPQATIAAVEREARLSAAVVVAGPVGALSGARRVLLALTELAVPTVLSGPDRWDPIWSPAVPYVLDAPELDAAASRMLWRAHLDGTAATDLDPIRETAHLHLGADQIARTAEAAGLSAQVHGTPVTGASLRASARAQNSAGLERLARRIEPAVGWADLVLPEPVLERVRELALRARHRRQVLAEWSMRPGGARGHGVTALFTGRSGTGKTTAAEVVAADLGLDLYTVDLSTVVDKYIGETEKNLARIFTEAADVNGVLLFDEADAIFGKRSAVSDARDKYANVESAYLLQRMESFDGLAILATNLRSNVDDAFTRRLDLIVDFPLPDETHRRRLWDLSLGRMAPRAADIDLDYCAARFELAGGDIRAAAITAAYAAAGEERVIGMRDLTRAAEQEYRKLGRLLPGR